jgi:hypothetical protein
MIHLISCKKKNKKIKKKIRRLMLKAQKKILLSSLLFFSSSCPNDKHNYTLFRNYWYTFEKEIRANKIKKNDAKVKINLA